MKKQLSEMTLEELWELFPIILSEHKDCWNDWYVEEEKRIKDFLTMDTYVCQNQIVENHSIEVIQMKDLQKKSFTYIYDTAEIIMSCILEII